MLILALFGFTLACAAAGPTLEKLPVVFEPNRGQAGSASRVVGRGAGFSVQFLDDGVGFTARGAAESLVWLEPVARRARPETESPLPGHSNYFRGPDPMQWRTGIPHFARVRYPGLFPGVDVVFYGNRGKLEFDCVVAAHADPAAIRFRLRGGSRPRLNRAGDLVVRTTGHELRFAKPVAYQALPEGRREVAAQFLLHGDSTVGFRLGRYDRTAPLIIDPVLLYNTYLGGTDIDIATAVTTDSVGNIYVAGYTASSTFSTTAGSYKTTLAVGDTDAYVMKLSSTGTAILYSTFLGGNWPDVARGIAVDSTGAAYITGSTVGRFPVTSGVVQETIADSPAIFVTKLSPNGATLAYSTYLAGAGSGQAIAVDSSNNAYVAGYTFTATYPVTAGVLQGTYGGATDGFVTKVNATGSALVYSTFVGGRREDQVTGMVVDSSGAAYVTGFTSSDNFTTTTGAYRRTPPGGTDAFAAKVQANGTAFVYSTYLGGANSDRAHAIAVDATGSAYIAGQTFSSDYPTTSGAFRPNYTGGPADAFVTKLAATGATLVYSTFLGGSGSCSFSDPFHTYQCDGAFGIALDSTGSAIVTGFAAPGFPVSGAPQASAPGGGDAFIAQLSSTGAGLLYSTYLGGTSAETGLAVAYSSNTGPVVVGITQSTDFPASSNALRPANTGAAMDGFLSRLGNCTAAFAVSSSFFPASQGSYTLSVSAPAGCGWVATTNVSWVTITQDNGNGNGQVNYTVAANTGPLRVGTLNIGAQTFTITQVSGTCVVLGSYSIWFPQAGSSYNMPVFATCAWSSSANVAWITITSGSGSGNGTLSFTVAANNTGVARTGQINVSGQILEVNQVGGPGSLSCSYNLSRSLEQFDRTGGSSSLLVATSAGCEWTVVNNNPWIVMTSGLAGSGEGVVGYTVEVNNTGQTRTGIFTVGGVSVGIVQAAQ